MNPPYYLKQVETQKAEIKNLKLMLSQAADLIAGWHGYRCSQCDYPAYGIPNDERDFVKRAREAARCGS